LATYYSVIPESMQFDQNGRITRLNPIGSENDGWSIVDVLRSTQCPWNQYHPRSGSRTSGDGRKVDYLWMPDPAKDTFFLTGATTYKDYPSQEGTGLTLHHSNGRVGRRLKVTHQPYGYAVKHDFDTFLRPTYANAKTLDEFFNWADAQDDVVVWSNSGEREHSRLLHDVGTGDFVGRSLSETSNPPAYRDSEGLLVRSRPDQVSADRLYGFSFRQRSYADAPYGKPTEPPQKIVNPPPRFSLYDDLENESKELCHPDSNRYYSGDFNAPLFDWSELNFPQVETAASKIPIHRKPVVSFHSRTKLLSAKPQKAQKLFQEMVQAPLVDSESLLTTKQIDLNADHFFFYDNSKRATLKVDTLSTFDFFYNLEIKPDESLDKDDVNRWSTPQVLRQAEPVLVQHAHAVSGMLNLVQYTRQLKDKDYLRISRIIDFEPTSSDPEQQRMDYIENELSTHNQPFSRPYAAGDNLADFTSRSLLIRNCWLPDEQGLFQYTEPQQTVVDYCPKEGPNNHFTAYNDSEKGIIFTYGTLQHYDSPTTGERVAHLKEYHFEEGDRWTANNRESVKSNLDVFTNQTINNTDALCSTLHAPEGRHPNLDRSQNFQAVMRVLATSSANLVANRVQELDGFSNFNGNLFLLNPQAQKGLWGWLREAVVRANTYTSKATYLKRKDRETLNVEVEDLRLDNGHWGVRVLLKEALGTVTDSDGKDTYSPLFHGPMKVHSKTPADYSAQTVQEIPYLDTELTVLISPDTLEISILENFVPKEQLHGQTFIGRPVLDYRNYAIEGWDAKDASLAIGAVSATCTVGFSQADTTLGLFFNHRNPNKYFQLHGRDNEVVQDVENRYKDIFNGSFLSNHIFSMTRIRSGITLSDPLTLQGLTAKRNKLETTPALKSLSYTVPLPTDLTIQCGENTYAKATPTLTDGFIYKSMSHERVKNQITYDKEEASDDEGREIQYADFKSGSWMSLLTHASFAPLPFTENEDSEQPRFLTHSVERGVKSLPVNSRYYKGPRQTNGWARRRRPNDYTVVFNCNLPVRPYTSYLTMGDLPLTLTNQENIDAMMSEKPYFTDSGRGSQEPNLEVRFADENNKWGTQYRYNYDDRRKAQVGNGTHYSYFGNLFPTAFIPESYNFNGRALGIFNWVGSLR